jgi:hypothetical protein
MFRKPSDYFFLAPLAPTRCRCTLCAPENIFPRCKKAERL